jgi:hypothetical protein
VFFTVLGLIAGLLETGLGLALIKLCDHPHFRELRRARRLLRVLGYVTGLLGVMEATESVIELGFEVGDDDD